MKRKLVRSGYPKSYLNDFLNRRLREEKPAGSSSGGTGDMFSRVQQAESAVLDALVQMSSNEGMEEIEHPSHA